MMLLIRLLLAHMVGDFFLQPKAWVKAKEKNKLKAYQLYLHALVHFALVMLFVFDTGFLAWAALLAVLHFAIDALKLYRQTKETKRKWFFVDQGLHLVSISLVFYLYRGGIGFDTLVFNDTTLMIAAMVVFLTMPASYIIKMFIARWSPDANDDHDDSLEDAGKYIGIIERLFVFVFVVTGHWEPVGFLLAAKSVFRFGDLRESKDRKLTEYILIGTLISFGIAILTALAYTAWRP